MRGVSSRIQTKPATIDIELDLGRYELRRRGRRVKLEKKPMELLIFLVSRKEQLVSRKEIVAKLWGSGRNNATHDIARTRWRIRNLCVATG